MNIVNLSSSRRNFLKGSASLITPILLPGGIVNAFSSCATGNKLATRGVVVTVDDLLTLNWPQLAYEAGLTTIGTHITPSQVAAYIQSDDGRQFLADCKKYNIQVEHELHSMHDLLPRSLFEKDPSMFRMNEKGERIADYNCCVNSKNALDIIAQNALKYANILEPTTGRYFYWIDDAAPMCMCGQCKDLTDSDQALVIENAIIKALKTKNPSATLAHLAYVNTMPAPKSIKPEEGIFLEFAPIYRRWDKPISDKDAGAEAPKQGEGGILTHGRTMEFLAENLKVFPVQTAQVLEYWLDVSLQSKWKKPAVKVDWHPGVFKKDIEAYTSAGIRNITTFAVYIDGEYKKKYKDLTFIKQYGDIMKKTR